MMNAKRIANSLTDYKVFVLLVVLFLAFSISSPRFATLANIRQVLVNESITIIAVCGQAMVIIGGGIDLSVGSLLALSGALSAILVAGNLASPILIIAIVIAIGPIAGLFNGLLITKGKIDPFIVTLGTMTIFRGLALIITKGRHIPSANANWFINIGAGRWFGIPFPVMIAMFLILITMIITKMTKFGRSLYALGGNKKAAWLSGVRVDNIAIVTYILTGVCVSISGFLQASRLASFAPMIGQGFELNTILSSVIGGISLLGGSGNIWGAVFGALLVGFLRNGLIILGISYYLEIIIIGIIFILAVVFDSAIKRMYSH